VKKERKGGRSKYMNIAKHKPTIIIGDIQKVNEKTKNHRENLNNG